MSRSRWRRIQELFQAAADLPIADRAAFLKRECQDDLELVADVLDLLQEDARPGSILDRGLASVVQGSLADDHPAGPAEIGPYRILKLLGEGGMGVVYLAERKDLGGQVAVKVLRDAWLSPARRERFENEQRTLVQLEHPAIAALHDAGLLADGTPWFSMEYVEGEPLTDDCAAHSLSVEARLRLFREVCEAVSHAHQRFVVHRDLKPSNILVKLDGTIKLLDFGIAKRIESLDIAADSTRTGLRMMTPAYAAPEQFRGQGFGVQTDIYSLGVILYELLTSRIPFDLTGLSPREAEALILEHVPLKPSVLARASGVDPALRHVGRAAWADLDVLCPKAMHKDPGRRYQTVEALIRDIDHFLKGEPLEARPDTWGYRIGKFMRRHTAGVAAACLMAVALISLTGFYTLRLASARNAALASAARTQRIQEFTLGLFQGGDPEAGPAINLQVSTLIDRGVLAARSLDGEPEVQADLYSTLGGIYQRLGHLSRASELLSLALERRTALLGAVHPEVARSLVDLGLLRLEEARYDEAEALIRDGLSRARHERAEGDELVAQASSALGQVLGARGQYSEAIRVLERAAQQRERAGVRMPEPVLAGILYELASVHFYAGNYAECEQLNLRVLDALKNLYGGHHPLVASVLVNLGAIRFELGQYADAEAHYRQAVNITEAWYGDEHPGTAGHQTMLGRALLYQGRHEEAALSLERALAIRERVYGLGHPAVASTLNEIGNIAVAQERYAEAEAAFQRMLAIYRIVYPDGHYLTAIALANLGSVSMNQKDYARAEPLLRQSIEIYEAMLGPDHLNTGIARIKLGRVLLRTGQLTAAEAQTLTGYKILSAQADPAVSFLRAARTDLVEIYRLLGRSDERARYQHELEQVHDAQARTP